MSRTDSVACVSSSASSISFESAETSSPSSIAFTGPIEAGYIDTERKPIPNSAIAEIGDRKSVV